MDALTLDTAPPDPLDLFAAWHADASAHPHIMYAPAACLSTIDPAGYPDGRIVIVHAFDADGFAFMTDRRSTKGVSLAQHPRAALTFYWGPLERQVRIQGDVEIAPDDEANQFFAERPQRSRVTAWTSVQSRTLGSRATLNARIAEQDRTFEHVDDIPRPPYWQSYRVRPHTIEFWVARARRLHDRIRYTRAEPVHDDIPAPDSGERALPTWMCTRLSP